MDLDSGTRAYLDLLDFERDTDTEDAQEMAQVGILPFVKLWPVGMKFKMAEQTFTMGPPCTREDFFAAVERAGLVYPGFQKIPMFAVFQRIYTD